MSQFQEFDIGDRVSVKWLETNQCFEGTIDTVNTDGTFDITYEALVHGKFPYEKQVKQERLTLLSGADLNYWEQDTKASHFDTSKMFAADILQGLETNNLEETRRICLSLTIQKLSYISEANPDDIPQLQQVIIDKLLVIDDLDKISSHLKYNQDCDAYADFTAIWLDIVASVFRIYSFQMEKSKKNLKNMPIPINEEIFDKCVKLIRDFFQHNFSNEADIVVSSSSSSGSSKKATTNSSSNKKSSGSSDFDAVQRRLFVYALEKVIPAMLHFLEMIRMFSYHCSPNGIIAHMLIDTCLTIISLDGNQNPLVDILFQAKLLPDMMKLYRSSSLLLRALFKRYEYRTDCMVGLLGSLYTISKSKNIWRPMVVDYRAAISVNITAPMYAIICCVQSLVTDIQGKLILSYYGTPSSSNHAHSSSSSHGAQDEMCQECSRASSAFIAELIQRCLNKESSDDYFTTVDVMVKDLLTAVQIPQLPGSILLMQYLIFNVSSTLDSVAKDVSESKRDYSMINQFLDIQGTIAEGLLRFGINWEKDAGVTFDEQLADIVKKRLTASWEQNRPLWWNVMINDKNDYWSTSAQQSAIANGHDMIPVDFDREDEQLLSFTKALDALVEINSDIIDVVSDAQQNFKRELVSPHLTDGCVTLTFGILPFLNETYDLKRLLSEVQESDLQHVIILRHLVEQYGIGIFSQFEVNCFDFDDEMKKDTCLMSMGQWLKTLKPLAPPQSTSSKRGSSTPTSVAVASTPAFEAIKKLVRDLTQSHGYADQKTPNIMRKSQLPLFLTDTKPQNQESMTFINLTLSKAKYFRSSIVRLLDGFLMTLQDHAPIIRSKSLKMISRMASVDPKILSFEKVQTALDHYVMNDKSIAVREEGVKLISGYVMNGSGHHFQQAQHYLMSLLPLLHDEGISVRRSVSNILRTILLKFPCHVNYRDICYALLERLVHPKEEESIKEHLCSLFQMIWFLPPSDEVCRTLQDVFTAYQQYIQQNKHSASNSTVITAVSTSSSSSTVALSASTAAVDQQHTIAGAGPKVRLLLQKLSERERLNPSKINFTNLHVKFTAMQLLEIVTDHTTARTWILSLLQELLHGKAAGNEASTALKNKRENCFKHCEKILAFQMELFLLLGEKDVDMMQYIEDSKFTVEVYQTGIFATFALFCTAHPPFVSKHLFSFLPYLKGQNGDRETIGYVIKILQATVELQKVTLREQVDGILNDLAKIALYQASAENANLAIECMASLIQNVSQDAKTYFHFIKIVFEPILAMAKGMVQVDTSKLRRALVVLGYLCNHSRKCREQLKKLAATIELPYAARILEAGILEEKAAELSLAEIPNITLSDMYGCCYSAVKYALQLEDEAVQISAVNSLCGVFAGYPKLMEYANKKDVMEDLFSDRYSEAVHHTFINGLKDMMVAEERRLERQAALQQMSESGVSIANAENVLGGAASSGADSTVGGFVLQQHLHILQKFLRHPTPAMRLSVLELLGTMLRQGTINPAEVMGDIIMLQCDGNENNRNESLKILLTEDEKHSSYIESKLAEGVEASFTLQMELRQLPLRAWPVQQTNTASGRVQQRRIPCFGAIYTSCIQSDRRKKNKFLQGLLDKCTSGTTHYLQSVITTPNSKSSKSSSSSGSTVNSVQSFQNTLQKMVVNLQKMQYFASILASLPFTTLDEPLYIVYHVSKFVPVEATSWLNRLMEALPHLGVTLASQLVNKHAPSKEEKESMFKVENTALEYIDASVDEEQVIQTIQQLLQSQSQSSQSSSHSQSQTKLWQALFTVANCIVHVRACEVLLRLKAHLKAIYNISDDRCLEFRPEDKNSANEKLPGTVDYCSDFSPSGISTTQQGKDTVATDYLCLLSSDSQLKQPATLAAYLVPAMQQFVDDFNRINHILQMNPNDFVLEDTGVSAGQGSGSGGIGSGRGRKTPQSGSKKASAGGSGSGSKSAATTPRKKRKKTPVLMNSSDEEDNMMQDFNDDDDEDDYFDEEEARRSGSGGKSKQQFKKKKQRLSLPSNTHSNSHGHGNGQSGAASGLTPTASRHQRAAKKNVNYSMIADSLE